MRCYYCGIKKIDSVEAILDHNMGASERINICSDACLRKIHESKGKVRPIPFNMQISDKLFR